MVFTVDREASEVYTTAIHPTITDPIISTSGIRGTSTPIAESKSIGI